MSNNLEQARRSVWLRRTRLLTGWIAAAAVVATLCIAAIAASASSSKKPASKLIGSAGPLAAPHRVLRLRYRKPGVHMVRVDAPRRTRHVAKHHATPPAAHVAAPPVAVVQAPAPAPPVAPVAVSGGS